MLSGEIGLVVDAEICSDMLSQVVMLAARLSERGDMRVRVVVFGEPGAGSALASRADELSGCGGAGSNKVRVFYLPRLRGVAVLDGLGLWGCKALADCALLHCFSLSAVKVLGILTAKKMGGGFCVSLSHWPGEKRVGELRRLSRRPRVRVICQSNALRESLVAGGVLAQGCVVIRAELEPEQKVLDRSAARRVLNVAEDLELVLADPEVSDWSNHLQLTWAAALMAQSDSKVRILVSGRGEQLKRVRAFDDSLKPPSLGIYVGDKYGPEVLYGGADVLALPATKVVSPMSLMRAGRAALPVVASNSPGFREYLSHERNSLLFAPGPHNAGDPTRRRIRPLATAIVRVLENRDLAGRLAKQLSKDMGKAFCGGDLLAEHVGVYGEVCG